jgi:hypothetical protein
MALCLAPTLARKDKLTLTVLIGFAGDNLRIHHWLSFGSLEVVDEAGLDVHLVVSALNAPR